MKHYAVHYKNKFLGTFVGETDKDILLQAWESLGYPCNKFSSIIKADFTLIPVGEL